VRRVSAASPEQVVTESSIPESSVRVRHGDAWSWSLRARASPKLGNVRFADWDAEGNCLAATTRGLFSWDGASWSHEKHELDHVGIRFVRSVGLGRWVVGSADACHVYAFGAMSLLWARDTVAFECFDGSLDEVALVGGRASNGATILRGCVRGHWLRPLTLIDVSVLRALSRIDEDRWLVTGRTTTDKPYAAIVAPLALKMKRLRTADLSAIAASAGRTELGMGCAVGSGGALVCGRTSCEVETSAAADLTAVAIDPAGRVVVAKPGHIWLRSAPHGVWRAIWEDETSRRPIASLFASDVVVRALANDAAILEGRSGEASAAPTKEPASRELPDLGDEDDHEATLPRASA
jgi:hypothetical protein